MSGERGRELLRQWRATGRHEEKTPRLKRPRVALAQPVRPGTRLGVIAPYRAQARLLRRALRATCKSRLEDGSIQVSTVHKFQGEERDLIVFDTTDAPRRTARGA